MSSRRQRSGAICYQTNEEPASPKTANRVHHDFIPRYLFTAAGGIYRPGVQRLARLRAHITGNRITEGSIVGEVATDTTIFPFVVSKTVTRQTRTLEVDIGERMRGMGQHTEIASRSL